MRQLTVCACLSVAVAASACGGDDGGDEPNGNAGSTLVSELTAAEASAICDEVNDDLGAFIARTDFDELKCTLEGLRSSTPSECESRRQDCIAEMIADMVTVDAPNDPDCPAVLDRCQDLTAADVTDCFAAQIAAFEQFYGMVTCDAAGDAAFMGASEVFSDGAGVPECDMLRGCYGDLVLPTIRTGRGEGF